MHLKNPTHRQHGASHRFRVPALVARLATLVANLAILAIAAAPLTASAQTSSSLDPFAKPSAERPNPIAQPTLSPGIILLMELEGRFAKDVAAGGGKAFASWFADDGMTLSNGQPPVVGHAAIAAAATWSPKDYQLTWTPMGGQMSAKEDMGFTWGHYEGRSRDKAGNPVVITGRYMTIWKKMPDGSWKVAMDSSANEPPVAGDCCALPKP